jgi:hypothetical protein
VGSLQFDELACTGAEVPVNRATAFIMSWARTVGRGE